MDGFTHRALIDLPKWADVLKQPYWRIRVEGRNKRLKRKCYRDIRIEKLRLVELGIDAELINAVCKYLVSHKQVNANRLKAVLETPMKQMSFNFFT